MGQTTYVKRSVPYKFDKGWFDLELARIARATKVITRDGVGGPVPLTFPTFAPAQRLSRSLWSACASPWAARITRAGRSRPVGLKLA